MEKRFRRQFSGVRNLQGQLNMFNAFFCSEETENALYLPTYIHAPPYFFGSILGYLIYTSRLAPVKINKVT